MTIASEILAQASRIDNSHDASLVFAIVSKLQRDWKATCVYAIDECSGGGVIGTVSNVRFNDGSYLYHNSIRDSWHTIREQAY